MVEQLQAMENTIPKKTEEKQKNRIKATFSLLDHAVKAYNSSETFIKRGLTLFGLGSVIAGASFSVGQNISSNQVALPQKSVDIPTSNLTSTSTPQKTLNSSFQTNPPQPQVIYLTPPNQSITVHNQQPTNQSSIPAHQQSELVVTNSPSPAPLPAPAPAPTPVPVNQAQKSVNTPPATNPNPIPDKQSQIIETVESVQQISGAIADIKQDFTPLFGEDDD